MKVESVGNGRYNVTPRGSYPFIVWTERKKNGTVYFVCGRWKCDPFHCGHVKAVQKYLAQGQEKK